MVKLHLFNRCILTFVSTEKLVQVLLVMPYLVQKEVTFLTRIKHLHRELFSSFSNCRCCAYWALGDSFIMCYSTSFMETIFGILRVFLMLLTQSVSKKLHQKKRAQHSHLKSPTLRNKHMMKHVI